MTTPWSYTVINSQSELIGNRLAHKLGASLSTEYSLNLLVVLATRVQYNFSFLAIKLLKLHSLFEHNRLLDVLSNWCFVATCTPATQTRPEDLMLHVLQEHSQRGVACETNERLDPWRSVRVQCAHYSL